jgi:hypothetical protein
MTPCDEFYIGYEPSLPPRMARRVRAAVLAASAAILAVAVLLTAMQRPLAEATFEYGHRNLWKGLLVRTPAPAILVPTRGGHVRYWLVGRGKHGADEPLRAVGDGWVEVVGTLIAREPWRMIEVAAVWSAPAPAGVSLSLAQPGHESPLLSVRGEVVDSKCFLGVMNPGERTVHRDCAVRCLSGGVPPMLAYRDAQGRSGLAVLVDASGRLLHDRVHHAVGRPVEATGRLFHVNDQPVFQLALLSGVAP